MWVPGAARGAGLPGLGCCRACTDVVLPRPGGGRSRWCKCHRTLYAVRPAAYLWLCARGRGRRQLLGFQTTGLNAGPSGSAGLWRQDGGGAGNGQPLGLASERNQVWGASAALKSAGAAFDIATIAIP